MKSLDEMPLIVSAKRTPMGAFQGSLSSLSATDLGARAIRGAVDASGLTAGDIQGGIMGCVLPAGLGQSPARQALLKAGLGHEAQATTVNKVCGSGLRSIMMACDQLRLNDAHALVAGGMENMSQAPYLLSDARKGYRLGHGKVIDHMMMDGLEDAYDAGTPMGCFAEKTASRCGFSRQDQDAFAIQSAEKALEAQKQGWFQSEITPVTLSSKKGDVVIDQDEPPSKVQFDKIPLLKPVFDRDGTVTAANASSISDGAAAVVLTTSAYAKEKSLTPLARVCGYVGHSQEPQWFTLAPVGAVQKLLDQVGWDKESVDLFEINEAFAVVTLAAIKELGLDPSKVNVHGGACALGHPIGASGARILTTLVHALKRKNLRRGIAALCIGGGEAVAMAVEAM